MPLDEYGNEIREEEEPQIVLPERKNKYAGLWDVPGSPMSPRVDTVAGEPLKKNKYSGIWDSVPTPPPIPPKKSPREMMELATKAGRIPSTNIVKDLIKKYSDPEYIARVDTAEHFKKTVSNLAKSAKGLVPGLVTLADKTVGAISRPGHDIMERGMEQAAAQKAKEMGMEPQANRVGGALEPLKNMADLALWAPKLIADVIKDPIGTVENRSLDLVMLAAGGALHKGIKKAGEGVAPKQPIPDVAGVIPKEQMPVIPGLGEVKGLGIEFVDDAGRPISRAEAFRGRQAGIEPSVEEPGKMKMVVAPKSPYEDSLSVVQNVIKESPKLIRSQVKLRHAELQERAARLTEVGQKLSGEAGLYEKYGILSKPLPAETAKPIRQLIPQEHVDNIYNMLETSPELSPFNKVHAGDGLRRIFEGELAQPSQLRMLEKVLGPDFIKTIETAKPFFTKLKELGIEIASVPRAWMASGDFSFGLRQGVVMAATHPVIFWKVFPKQFKYFAKEKFLEGSNIELASRDTFKLAVDSDLSLTGMEKYVDRVAGKGRHEYLTREEPFQSHLAERVPVMGQMTRASNRAYSGFANRLRMDSFDYLVKRAIDKGRDPFNDPKLARSIATVVNSGTGRGSLGKFERYAPILNATIFSPKLAISRFEVLLNPLRFKTLDKFARVEAIRQLVSTTGAGLTILGLAKMAGAKVGTDWRSADFGKIIIGNTRFDVWGGFVQYARLAGQLFTGEVVSSTTGKVSRLGEGYRPRTQADILRTAVEYKLSPPFSFALSLLKGQEAFGGEFKLTDEVAKRLIPIVIQDLVDVYKDDPSLLPISALGIFGVGLQTYSPSSYRKRHGQRTSLQW